VAWLYETGNEITSYPLFRRNQCLPIQRNDRHAAQFHGHTNDSCKWQLPNTYSEHFPPDFPSEHGGDVMKVWLRIIKEGKEGCNLERRLFGPIFI
jgi:hypothetical protein